GARRPPARARRRQKSGRPRNLRDSAPAKDYTLARCYTKTVRRRAVYSASKASPAVKPAKPAASAKPAPVRRPRFAWRKALVPSAIVAMVLAVWLAQPPAITQAQVEALVHRAIDEIPPRPSATDAYEKILPSVVGVRAMADDGE